MINDTQTQSVLTITQLTRSIKILLEGEYKFIRVRGEISNLKTPFSGHSYFSLKDAQSQIRAVLFKNQKRYLNCRLADGQQVICFGRISVYEPRGEYQFIVDTVEQYGIGNLQREFEKLKEKLSNEGLFSEKYKKKIPPHPEKIALISSPTGAALKDFLKIAFTRESPVHFQILPVKVQGKMASTEIAQAIKQANRLNGVEIIVLCRGGGSIEDLWAFNEEEVARAIFDSDIPIVTGIGHEVDFTIADFCADFRCPTPTGAATKILPDIPAVLNHLAALKKRVAYFLEHKISKLELKTRNNIRLLSDLDRMFENMDLRLNLSKIYLHQEIGNNLSYKETHFRYLLQKLESHAPLAKLELREHKLKLLVSKLINQIQTHLNNKESEFTNATAVLNSVSPLATLARGYSIVTKYNAFSGRKEIVCNGSSVVKADNLEILLHKGTVQCTVTGVQD
jgi:exodeoxyribonuclease VII large subunit